MDKAKRLKLAAVFFAVFWVGGMLWWSGEYHPAYIILLTVCGSLGGYLWYLACAGCLSTCTCFRRAAIRAAAGRRHEA